MRAFALAAGLSLAAATAAFAADPVEGDWLTQSGSAKVRVAPCAGKADRMCGVIVWLRDPANAKAHDDHNPDPAQRTRAIMGLRMLWGFQPAASGRWTGGKIYDPNSGKTYDSKISVNPDGTLEVDGCIMVLCQAQTWRRG
jgi:uncharacterized protein (DUF2147 family)